MKAVPVTVSNTLQVQTAMPSKLGVSSQVSRRFTRSDTDTIDLATGACGIDGAQMTVAWIWRPRSVAAMGLLYASSNVGNTAFVYNINPYSSGFYFFDVGASGRQQREYEVDIWCVDVVTNDVAANKNFCHHYSYDTGVWTHDDMGAAFAGSGTLVDHLHIGQFDNVNEHLDADLAVLGIWDRTLSAVEIETLPPELARWETLAPVGLWAFNQSNVGESVADLTGNGADQTARDGTTITVGELPAAFRY